MTAEVAIPQRYHRAIMGPKGCRIQHITREHEVQIKFPEREDSAAGENGEASEASEASVESVPTSDRSIFTTAQEAFLHENGEVSPEDFLPRKCDIITISGRAEKCELAKAALLVGVRFPQASACCGLLFARRHVVALLQVLVPITEDVGVSYELHRFIIGQKGSGIRKMMEEYEVTLLVLPPSAGQLW